MSGVTINVYLTNHELIEGRIWEQILAICCSINRNEEGLIAKYMFLSSLCLSLSLPRQDSFYIMLCIPGCITRFLLVLSYVVI